MKDAEAKPLTDEELERVISELYFEKVERIVKQNGKIKFKGKRSLNDGNIGNMFRLLLQVIG
jgi:hypothetical protein